MSEALSWLDVLKEQLSSDGDAMKKLYPEASSEKWSELYDEMFKPQKKEFDGIPIGDNVSIFGKIVNLNADDKDDTIKPKSAVEIGLNIKF